MSRYLLAIGGAVVVIGAIALFLALRGGSSEVAPMKRSPGTVDGEKTRPITRADHPSVPELDKEIAAAGSGEVKVLEDGTREYMINGTLVRDHRKAPHEQRDLPPNVHSPQGPRITSALSAAITSQFKTVLVECAQSVPPEARGPAPKLDGTIAIDVKAGTARITSASAQLRDVVGAALDPTKQCIEQKAVGLSVPAGPENPEVSNYSISVSYRLP